MKSLLQVTLYNTVFALMLMAIPAFAGIDTIQTDWIRQSDYLEIVVRPTDLDVNGHVNNAKYIEYLQWGRWNWLNKRGLTHNRLKAIKSVPVVVNLNINYRKECSEGDVLTIITTPEDIKQKSFTFRQLVLPRIGDPVADAVATMVVIDPTTRKSRLLPNELAKVLIYSGR